MKKLLLTLVVSLSGASAWSVPIAGDAGHYYDVIQAPGITWADARVAALSSFYLGLQGHLVTITSAAEHGFVNTAIGTIGGEMWAGGYQDPAGELDPTAGWTWVNGEGSFPGVNSAAPYALWNGGEPNDAYGPGSEQFLGLNFGAGGFNDEGNLGNITGYVIEYDPNTINDIPDSGATAAMLGGAFVLLGAFSRRLRK